MGDLAARLRRARLEISDAHRVVGCSNQLFLASAVRCELGARSLLPGAARGARVRLSAGLSSSYSGSCLLSDAPILGFTNETEEVARLILLLDRY